MTSGDEDPRARRDAGDETGQADLEDALRGMLARRAEHIRSAATWRPPEGDAGRGGGLRRPGGIPARRWLLPAAAAAVVVALVVTVITVRGSGSPASNAVPGPASGTTSGTASGTTTATSGSRTPGSTGASTGPDGLAPAPAPVAQRPIPAGMQAVDALGVEIFVPSSLALDPRCDGKSVSRPAYGLNEAVSCIPEEPPVVRIMTATNAVAGMAPTTGPCAGTIELDGEDGCVRVPDPDGPSAAVVASVIWPQHDVAVTATYPAGQRKHAMAVVTSAHWVSVDRHGCAVARSPVVPADAASLPEGPVLPAHVISTSACWYSSGRLVASATLPSTATKSLPRAGVIEAPGAGTSYSPSPDGPACSTLGRTDGIVFQATRPDSSIAVSSAQFADCTGGQFWTDGTHAQPADAALAWAVQGLAGFPLSFGYQATPLDPETSGSPQAAAPPSTS